MTLECTQETNLHLDDSDTPATGKPLSTHMIPVRYETVDGQIRPTLKMAGNPMTVEISGFSVAATYEFHVFDFHQDARNLEHYAKNWPSLQRSESAPLPWGGGVLMLVREAKAGVGFEIHDMRRQKRPGLFGSWDLSATEHAQHLACTPTNRQDRAMAHLQRILAEMEGDGVADIIGAELAARSSTRRISFGSVSIQDVVDYANDLMEPIGAEVSFPRAALEARLNREVEAIRRSIQVAVGKVAMQALADGLGVTEAA